MKKLLHILIFFIPNWLIGDVLDSLLKLSVTNRIDSAYVMLLSNICAEYNNRGEFEKALRIGERAVRIADSIHSKWGLQAALNDMGNCYIDQGNVKKALECRLKVLQLREELKDKAGIAHSYLNLGNIYLRLGEDNEALKNYSMSIKLLYEVGDTLRVAAGLSNMGGLYSNKGMIKESEQCCLKALAIRKRYNDIDGTADIYANLCVIFMDAKRYKQALDYAFKSIELYEASKNKLGITISYSNIGDVYEHLDDLNNAIKYQQTALKLALEMGSSFMLETCYQLLATAYSKKGDFVNAVKYIEQFSQLRDSTMSLENGKMIAEMQARYETGRKEKEIQLLQTDKSIRELQLSKQDASINRQRIIIYSVIGGLLIMTFLIIFILKEYRQKKKIQLGLEKKNLEISIQKNQIEEKSRLITDSIDYAKNIQSAILPPDEKIKSVFPESFIIFEPKEIVSGDFYWLSRVKDTDLFATVDCEGEGVPGAFMSIMVNSMLENIVLEKKLTDPFLIIEELSKKYKAEISLIALNQKKNELQFAGTKMPLVIIRDSKINKFVPESGKSQTVPLKKNDMLYLFTDGALQYTGFIEAMPSLALQTIEEQKQMHQNKIKMNEQTDDYLVMGIRV